MILYATVYVVRGNDSLLGAFVVSRFCLDAGRSPGGRSHGGRTRTTDVDGGFCSARTSVSVCHSVSKHIHSRYTRTIADLPTAGRVCRLLLRVRRFFCDVSGCPRKIFAERLGTELPAFARRTVRLTAHLIALAYAAGGHGGARLAHRLAMPTSSRTLLRLLHAQPAPTFPAPQVVGLDEWAWNKGRTYGTRCVDLERHQPIDLLPDRTPESVAAWLQAHPSSTTIARDRNGGYIDGITPAPGAAGRQVASGCGFPEDSWADPLSLASGGSGRQRAGHPRAKPTEQGCR